jgi:5'-3' exonuclease
MGVPALFSFLVRNYPEIIFYNSEQDIDNLYLDMNCAIHPCCYKALEKYPNWDDEEYIEDKMLKEIINYVKYIIKFVNPKQLVYFAIDGPAPRAKMRQQRMRRFKSMKEKRLIEDVKEKYNIKKKSWNNSKITPGTVFMQKVSNALKDYIKKDKQLSKLKVIYSDSNVPQEGEHKLYQHIKTTGREKVCIYGLDADLIFLGLAVGREDVFLLREADYLNNGKGDNDELHYFSIDLLKKNLFNYANRQITSNIDCDKFIQDFVVMCFLLGNDFLPHLEGLHIKQKGLDLLMEIYSETFDSFHDKYLVDNGINQRFLQKILNQLSSKQDELFQLENKDFKPRKFESEYEEELDVINRAPLVYDNVMLKDKGYRERYYRFNLGMSELELEEDISELCANYLEGVVWTMHYYMDECPSWDWYYKYSHGPLLSDLAVYVNQNNIDDICFEKGKPYKPFTQLLMVLPPISKEILPKSYQVLMEKNSPIYDYYPVNFVEDFAGKMFRWEGVPYLPDIDKSRIDDAIRGIKLSKEEIVRNRLEECLVY